MKKISTSIAAAVTYLTVAASVHAQAPGSAFKIKPTGIIKDGGSTTIEGIIAFVVAVVSIIAVLATLIYLVWGAIKWITSGGDKTKVEAARGQIVAAIIGFIIVVLSFVILNVVATLLGLGNIFDGFTIPKL